MTITRLTEAPIHPGFIYGEDVRIGHGVVIEEGVVMGNNVLIGHNVVIRPKVCIGSDVRIGHNTTIEDDVVIDTGCRIQANCYITRGTRIASQVFIGPCVCTTNDWKIATHGRPIAFVCEPAYINHGARIGARVLLMPGVTIGTNALIGAGSIVAKDVPPNAVVHGERAQETDTVPEEHRI